MLEKLISKRLPAAQFNNNSIHLFLTIYNVQRIYIGSIQNARMRVRIVDMLVKLHTELMAYTHEYYEVDHILQ